MDNLSGWSANRCHRAARGNRAVWQDQGATLWEPGTVPSLTQSGAVAAAAAFREGRGRASRPTSRSASNSRLRGRRLALECVEAPASPRLPSSPRLVPWPSPGGAYRVRHRSPSRAHVSMRQEPPGARRLVEPGPRSLRVIVRGCWTTTPAGGDPLHVPAWPVADPALLVEESVTWVVQVPGKVRDRLQKPPSPRRGRTAGSGAGFGCGAAGAGWPAGARTVVVRPPSWSPSFPAELWSPGRSRQLEQGG